MDGMWMGGELEVDGRWIGGGWQVVKSRWVER